MKQQGESKTSDGKAGAAAEVRLAPGAAVCPGEPDAKTPSFGAAKDVDGPEGDSAAVGAANVISAAATCARHDSSSGSGWTI